MLSDDQRVREVPSVPRRKETRGPALWTFRERGRPAHSLRVTTGWATHGTEVQTPRGLINLEAFGLHSRCDGRHDHHALQDTGSHCRHVTLNFHFELAKIK